MSECYLKTKTCNIHGSSSSSGGRPVAVYPRSYCPVLMCGKPGEVAGYCKIHYFMRYRMKQRDKPCLTPGCKRKVIYASRCRRCNAEIKELKIMGHID